MPLVHTFTTIDHPEAAGREAQDGEPEWKLTFTLETGNQLVVRMGRTAHDAIKRMFEQEEIDDAADAEVSGN